MIPNEPYSYREYEKHPHIDSPIRKENISPDIFSYELKENRIRHSSTIRTILNQLTLKSTSEKIPKENTIILLNQRILKSFQQYFEPEIETIPKYKDKDWLYKEFNEYEKTRKRKSKHDDPDHSVRTANLARFTDIALAIISSIWENVFQSLYGCSFVPAGVEFFEGHIATIPNLRGGKSAFASPIFHLGSNNTIYISREVLETIDFHTTENSPIGLTLTLAHEVGHSIRRQLPVQMSKAQKEDMADFVAGYTMHILEEMGLLGEDDIATALLYFASIGTSPGDRVGERVHDTPEGRKSHLMRGYTSDIEGVRQEFDQYNPISTLHQRFIEILDSLGTGTIILEKNMQSYNIH